MIPWQLGVQQNAAMYSNAHAWMQTFDCCCTGCDANCADRRSLTQQSIGVFKPEKSLTCVHTKTEQLLCCCSEQHFCPAYAQTYWGKPLYLYASRMHYCFSDNSSLRKNFYTHTGKRPRACAHPGCTAAFVDSSHLKTHSHKHTGERPHICPHPGC